jgi:hypothetical protein
MADRFQRLGPDIARKRFYKIGKSLEAMPQIKKIDIEDLKKAYAG